MNNLPNYLHTSSLDFSDSESDSVLDNDFGDVGICENPVFDNSDNECSVSHVRYQNNYQFGVESFLFPGSSMDNEIPPDLEDLSHSLSALSISPIVSRKSDDDDKKLLSHSLSNSNETPSEGKGLSWSPVSSLTSGSAFTSQPLSVLSSPHSSLPQDPPLRREGSWISSALIVEARTHCLLILPVLIIACILYKDVVPATYVLFLRIVCVLLSCRSIFANLFAVFALLRCACPYKLIRNHDTCTRHFRRLFFSHAAFKTHRSRHIHRTAVTTVPVSSTPYWLIPHIRGVSLRIGLWLLLFSCRCFSLFSNVAIFVFAFADCAFGRCFKLI